MLEDNPTAEPAVWLKKQLLLTDNKPTVGAVVLFADEPQGTSEAMWNKSLSL